MGLRDRLALIEKRVAERDISVSFIAAAGRVLDRDGEPIPELPDDATAAERLVWGEACAMWQSVPGGSDDPGEQGEPLPPARHVVTGSAAGGSVGV